jgi:hypothetical protein
MSADQDMKKSYWYPSFLLFQAQLIICDQHGANVLVSRTVYHEFDPSSGQTKDDQIPICCFSTKHW